MTETQKTPYQIIAEALIYCYEMKEKYKDQTIKKDRIDLSIKSLKVAASDKTPHDNFDDFISNIEFIVSQLKKQLSTAVVFAHATLPVDGIADYENHITGAIVRQVTDWLNAIPENKVVVFREQMFFKGATVTGSAIETLTGAFHAAIELLSIDANDASLRLTSLPESDNNAVAFNLLNLKSLDFPDPETAIITTESSTLRITIE